MLKSHLSIICLVYCNNEPKFKDYTLTDNLQYGERDKKTNAKYFHLGLECTYIKEKINPISNLLGGIRNNITMK